MKKLRGSRGVTLTETLCTVLIVLLISAMLAVGVRFAVRTYRESMELSETELLCSTLTAAISDKLRYSSEVGQNMFIQGVGTTDSGGGGSFAISDDGEVVILEIQQDENGEDIYVSVEDDDVSQAVFDKFMEAMDAEDEE